MEDTTQDPINAPHHAPPEGHGADPVDKTPGVTNTQKANTIRVRLGALNEEIGSLLAERDRLNSDLLQLELGNDNA